MSNILVLILNYHFSIGFDYDFYLGSEEVKFFFFTNNNIGSYIKALSTNYKSVFVELKKTI